MAAAVPNFRGEIIQTFYFLCVSGDVSYSDVVDLCRFPRVIRRGVINWQGARIDPMIDDDSQHCPDQQNAEKRGKDDRLVCESDHAEKYNSAPIFRQRRKVI